MCPSLHTILFPYTTLFRSLRDRVLHEHGGDNEEPGRDGDLPPQEKPLAPAALRSGGRSAGERAANVERARQLNRTLDVRSEEHTSELQSPDHLVCRLLLEK